MDLNLARQLNTPLIQAMWSEHGIIAEWYLKPKQKEVYEFIKKTRDPFFEASRRLGKTTITLTHCLETMAQNPEHIVRWCEPWKKQCREIVMTEVDQIQRGLLYRDRIKFKSTDSHYVHPKTGSKLYLAGVNDDRGESARGPKAHIIVADELGTWKEPLYILGEVLGPQLLTTHGLLIRLGTPPRNLTHEFYQMKEQAEAKGVFIQRTIRDQEIASWDSVEENIERAGGWESAAVQREYLCKKTKDINYSIVPEWDAKYIAETPKDQYFPFYLKYTGMDIGSRDLTVVLFAYYDFLRAKLVILDEVVINGANMTTEKVAEAQREKEKLHFGCEWELDTTDAARPRWRLKKVPNFRMRRISDVDLRMVADMSTLHGLYYEATDKGGLEEMVNQMRIWVGGDKLEVSPNCKHLIQCLEYGCWDENRKAWERSDMLGHFDGLAALMYLIRNVSREVGINPIPPQFGHDTDSWLMTQDPRIEKREKIKKMFNIQNRR